VDPAPSPLAPDDADAGGQAVLGIGVVAAIAAVLFFLGIAFGFFLGTRARQLLASLKQFGQAIRSFTIKIPSSDAASGAMGAASANDDEAENEDVDNKVPSIDDYMNSQLESRFDDHPDLFVNPVLLYQIKIEGDQQRELKRLAERKQLLEQEGLSAEELAERLAEGDGLDLGRGTQQRNALQTLISVGARVEPAKGESAEGAAAAERRRLWRNIDVYLQRAKDADTRRIKQEHGRTAKGDKVVSPYEIAQHTQLVPAGGDDFARFSRNVRIAKEARKIYRRFKATLPAEVDLSDSDGEGDPFPKQRRGGGLLSAEESAGLAMYLDEDADEGEEGGNQLEGPSDPDIEKDLAA